MIRAQIIRASGEEFVEELEDFRELHLTLDATLFDTVNLRDGRHIYVDDLGHTKNKPVNPKATAMYHGVCVPGTTHQIVGDVAIISDDE